MQGQNCFFVYPFHFVCFGMYCLNCHQCPESTRLAQCSQLAGGDIIGYLEPALSVFGASIATLCGAVATNVVSPSRGLCRTLRPRSDAWHYPETVCCPTGLSSHLLGKETGKLSKWTCCRLGACDADAEQLRCCESQHGCHRLALCGVWSFNDILRTRKKHSGPLTVVRNRHSAEKGK